MKVEVSCVCTRVEALFVDMSLSSNAPRNVEAAKKAKFENAKSDIG